MSKKKNRELQWNVYYENINATKEKIRPFNVFDHWRFKEETEKHLDKCETKERFSEEMKKTAMYYYWCKAEWEIVLCTWVPYIEREELDRLNEQREKFVKNHDGQEPRILDIRPAHGEKIDVYSQLELNWGIFIDYLWNKK